MCISISTQESGVCLVKSWISFYFAVLVHCPLKLVNSSPKIRATYGWVCETKIRMGDERFKRKVPRAPDINITTHSSDKGLVQSLLPKYMYPTRNWRLMRNWGNYPDLMLDIHQFCFQLSKQQKKSHKDELKPKMWYKVTKIDKIVGKIVKLHHKRERDQMMTSWNNVPALDKKCKHENFHTLRLMCRLDFDTIFVWST